MAQKASTIRWMAALASVSVLGMQGCGEGSGPSASGSSRSYSYTVVEHQSEIVQQWSLKAAETYNAAAQFGPPLTDYEQRPNWNSEMAMIHVAMYDALAVLGYYGSWGVAYNPLIATNTRFLIHTNPAWGPSGKYFYGPTQEAIVNAAAYGVARGLWPERSTVYQKLYDDTLARLKGVDSFGDVSLGDRIGLQVAAEVLQNRATDGRMEPFGPYASGTSPGQYRLPPIPLAAPFVANIRPFRLQSASQFRAPGPYALTDPRYATDFNETRDLGGAASTLRSADQTAAARFHTEAPNLFWPRNLAQFAHWKPGTSILIEDARLSAMLWVAVSDAVVACWDSKFHYYAWRPQSAIALADSDGNNDTVADSSWAPLGPVPPHPEYPAAHACVAGAIAETLANYFGSRKVSFSFEASTLSPAMAPRTYASVDEFLEHNFMARIWGGQHFRHSLEDGQAIGSKVAKQVYSTSFIAAIDGVW